MRPLATAIVLALALTSTASAHNLKDGKLGKSERELRAQVRHSSHVIAFFNRGGPGHWLIAPTKRSCMTKPTVERIASCMRGRSVLRGHRWLHRLARQRLAALAPPRPFVDSCLHQLLMREGGYNPHKWNGGHVAPWTPYTTYGGSGAYGGPQALPGNKMASAGPDWADNIWTQIRWMKGYVQKYGGSCGALAFQIANGYY